MGSMVTLQASDGHRLSAYRAEPAARGKGAVLVVQEIFGVNSHIRQVCDGYAADGWVALAPALFDRLEPGVELGYSAEDIARGRELRGQVSWEVAMRDLQAAADSLRTEAPIGVVGYCWGGTLAWLAAARVDGLAAAVGYYGGGIGQFAAEPIRVPAMLHFGSRDAMIPPEEIDKLRTAHPDVTIHTYDAGHGFNCDQRQDYNPEAAKLARERTVLLFQNVLSEGRQT